MTPKNDCETMTGMNVEIIKLATAGMDKTQKKLNCSEELVFSHETEFITVNQL